MDSLSVELVFRIPIFSGISDSWSCIMDSKARDSIFYKFKFPGFRIAQSKISRGSGNLIPWGDPWVKPEAILGYTVPLPYLDSHENKLYYDLKA